MELISGSDFTLEQNDAGGMSLLVTINYSEDEDNITVHPNICDNTGNPVVLIHEGYELFYTEPVFEILLTGGEIDRDGAGRTWIDDFYVDDFYPWYERNWDDENGFKISNLNIDYEVKTIDDIRFNISNDELKERLTDFINENKESVAQMLTEQNKRGV